VHASIHNALLAQVVDSLSTLLPFSPGGAGTKQGLLVYVLHGEASSAQLLAFSVGQYVARDGFNVAIGAIAIFASLGTLRLRKVIGQAKASESSEPGVNDRLSSRSSGARRRTCKHNATYERRFK
jgi:uncharacterized membrane protein YbhN (UPF0104 family)